MASAGSVTLDLKPLRKLRAEMVKAAARHVDVGIFSADNSRYDSELTNADIGFKHEYGEYGIPRRSFIEMPLTLKLGDELKANADWVFEPLTEEGSVKLTLERVGFQAQAVIREAFDTQGFGRWPDNSEQTQIIKGRNEPLVDTTQMRESITSRVAK